MAKRISIVAAIGMCFLLVSHSAFALGLEAAVGAWNQDPSGDISFKGTSLDIEKDLKYDDENRIMGRLKIETPIFLPNIYLMATPMRFDGTGRKDIAFTFGDRTYAGNVDFTSKLRIDQYDLALYYNLPFLRTLTRDILSVELGINIRGADVEAEVTQGSITEKESFFLPVPMAYVGLEVKPIKPVSIGAELRGIAYSSNHAYDIIGRIKWRFLGPLFIGAGYRYEDIKIDHEDLKARAKVKGPFAELGLVF